MAIAACLSVLTLVDMLRWPQHIITMP